MSTADLWAAKGVKSREDEWVDTTYVVWSEVTGLCGFWDGSCDDGKCGAGIMIQAFPHFQKMYAELGGCDMLMENLRACVNKEHQLLLWMCLSFTIAFFGGMPCAGGPLPRPPNPASCGMRVACGSGVRGFVVLGCVWNEGQDIRVSYDIDRDQQAQKVRAVEVQDRD